jgi:hypothetical protein
MAFGQYTGGIGAIAGGIIGGIIGTIYPGIGTYTGAMLGASLGGMVGGVAGQVFWPEKTDANHPPPPQPHETRLQISTYGAAVPIVYSAGRLAGNIFEMSDIVETIERSKHRQDGVRYYEMKKTYTATFAIAFCAGRVPELARIWVNGKVFADYRYSDSPYYPSDGALAEINLDTTIARSTAYFAFYRGSETQAADATLASIYTAAEVPAYRGICYIVFKDFPVGEYSGIPNIEIEVSDITRAYFNNSHWQPVDFSGALCTWDDVNQQWDSDQSDYTQVVVSLKALGSWMDGLDLGYVTIDFTMNDNYEGRFYFDIATDYPQYSGETADEGTYAAGNSYTITIDLTDFWASVLPGSKIDTISFYNTSWEGSFSITGINFVPEELEVETLASVVTDLCEKAGITAAHIDVTDLTDDVLGFTVPRQMPARTALETLMAAFNFDAAEEDWKLVFKKRGAASIATIAAADLRAHPADGQVPDRAVETRTQDLELPTHFSLSYESKARDYEIASQHAVRVDKATFLPKSSALGLVMTDDYAKQQAELLLKQMWRGRHKYAFSTTYKYLKLAPGDVTTVNGKEMRVIEMSDRGGIIDFACEAEEAGGWTSGAVSDDLTKPATDLASDAYVPSFIGLDLPPLSEDHGSAGLYFALYGTAAAFKGGTIQRSIDGGATYQDVGYVAVPRAVVGACLETLADGIAGCLDYTVPLLDVGLWSSEGTLSSATDAQLDEGANLAAVGSGSSWEIIQFKTASGIYNIHGFTYRLTGLRRGLYGTERFMATHGSGEYFVKLDSLVGIDFVGAQTAAIGASYNYRIKNSSGALGTATAYVTGGLALECFAPQGPFGGFNGDGDCILTWRRGDRYEFAQADFPDGVDVAMSELTEAYEVDVIHPSTYAVVRTLTSATPTVSYTAAQRSTDVYPAGPITFDIYQLSGVVGRGIVKRVTV